MRLWISTRVPLTPFRFGVSGRVGGSRSRRASPPARHDGGSPRHIDSATHYDDGTPRPQYNRGPVESGPVEWGPLWKTLAALAVLTAALASIGHWGYTGLLVDVYTLVGVPLIWLIVWLWRGG